LDHASTVRSTHSSPSATYDWFRTKIPRVAAKCYSIFSSSSLSVSLYSLLLSFPQLQCFNLQGESISSLSAKACVLSCRLLYLVDTVLPLFLCFQDPELRCSIHGRSRSGLPMKHAYHKFINVRSRIRTGSLDWCSFFGFSLCCMMDSNGFYLIPLMV
jgi:hypothetical protein